MGIFREDVYFMLNQKVSNYSYQVSKNMFKVKIKQYKKSVKLAFLKLIQLMILLLTRGVKSFAKLPSNFLFLKGV